ncbi:hypothetical protein M989_00153 [Kluyvera georgiana ATCC 51603]|uniref:Uncharacterized protein n=1 Tax=Kluyvera georgiana ATCC 51603 TaxID=1354264 RepID=A0A1B7K828_9ENTR|nr:hypothetical protein M989_00153 [Kluyvera georgiana ATCC 51603]
MNNKCICLVLMTSSCMVFQATAATDLTPLYSYQDDNQATPLHENTTQVAEVKHHVLPFWGDEARL